MARKAFLIEIISTDTLTTLRFSSNTIQKVYNGFFWDPRVEQVGSIQTSVLGNGPIINGRGFPRFGTFVINNHDGEYDTTISGTQFEDGDITIYQGEHGDVFGNFTQIVLARIKSVEWDRERIRFLVVDKFNGSNIVFSPNTYGGTGTEDGDAGAKGQSKPISFGDTLNLNGVVISQASLVYQIHDGSGFTGMQTIDVFDRGVALANAGDLASVFTWTPIAGSYVTDLTRGIFRLGAEPDGPVTADGFRGVILPGAVIFDLGINHAGLTPVTEIDNLDTAVVNAERPYQLGIYVRDPAGVNVISIIEKIMNDVTGFVFFTATGKMQFGFYEIGTIGNIISLLNVRSYRRLQTPTALWRVRYGFNQSHVVQFFEDLATGATPQARRELVGRDYGFAIAENTAIRTRRPDAQEAERLSFIVNEANALTEATRQITLLGDTDRNIYEVDLIDQIGIHTVGDIVGLNLERFGLTASSAYQVVGVTENFDTNITNLIVWG